MYYDGNYLVKPQFLEIGKELMSYNRNRPVSPYYMEYAPKITTVFNQTPKGEVIP